MKYEKAKIDIADHVGRIGCSQLAGALGVSDWKDASINALRSFRGEPIPEPDEATRERMELGTWYEDPTARLAAKRLGLKIKRDTFAHWRADIPELICHPDRLIVGGFRGVKNVALEIKTASTFAKNWGDEWTDDIPTQYLMQCIGYVICGVAEAVLLAAFKSDSIRYYWVHPTKETVEQVAQAFLKWLENARNPEWIPMPTDPEETKKQYPFLVKEGKKEASFELFATVGEAGSGDHACHGGKQDAHVRRREDRISGRAQGFPNIQQGTGTEGFPSVVRRQILQTGFIQRLSEVGEKKWQIISRILKLSSQHQP